MIPDLVPHLSVWTETKVSDIICQNGYGQSLSPIIRALKIDWN